MKNLISVNFAPHICKKDLIQMTDVIKESLQNTNYEILVTSGADVQFDNVDLIKELLQQQKTTNDLLSKIFDKLSNF